MVQVENEYGSFGNDKVYLNAIRQMINNAGFDVTLFTSDGDQNKLAEGTLPDLLSVINFGATDSPEKKFTIFDKFRQLVPRMCGEFWVGWFDSWGEQLHQFNNSVRAHVIISASSPSAATLRSMACLMALNSASSSIGFVKNSTAPAFMACTVIGTSP